MSLQSCFLFLLIRLTFINGKPSLDDRIIGGTSANITSLPYQVSLQNSNGHFCGGSVIHYSYILTAAHCLENENIKSITIRAGSHFHNKEGIVSRICSVITHDSYIKGADNYDYDIAIIKVCENLRFGPNILPIALPKFDENVRDGISAMVSGWGYNDKNEFPNQLQRVSLVTINQAACRKRYQKVGNLTGRMLCAGCKKGVCDSCLGDSGGPLIAGGKLVGIVSWGYGCAEKDYPGIYTKVAKFRKWIKTKIKI